MYYNNVVRWAAANSTLLLALAILILIAGGLILRKAGDKPWKIIIPIYGVYCLYKAANSEGIFWGTLGVSIASGVISSLVAGGITSRYTYSSYIDSSALMPIYIISIITGIIMLILQITYVRRLAGVFGKGGWFAAGLFFLFPIFAMILGFGSAQYVGAYSGLNSVASSTGSWKCSVCGCDNPTARGTCQSCGAPK